MKTKLLLSALLMLCLSTFVHAQGNLPPWLIELAPDKDHVLFSGPGGVYDHAKLDSLVGLYQTRAAFYHFVNADSSYTLPIDTLIKYDIITISVQTSHTRPNNLITFPDIPDSIYNGKLIVLNMDSGDEVLDTVLVQVAGDSRLIQDDCYQVGKSIQDDLFLINYYNPQTVIYHTGYRDDYYRQCTRFEPVNIYNTNGASSQQRYYEIDWLFDVTPSLYIGYFDELGSGVSEIAYKPNHVGLALDQFGSKLQNSNTDIRSIISANNQGGVTIQTVDADWYDNGKNNNAANSVNFQYEHTGLNMNWLVKDFPVLRINPDSTIEYYTLYYLPNDTPYVNSSIMFQTDGSSEFIIEKSEALLYNGVMDSIVSTGISDLQTVSGWLTFGRKTTDWALTDTSAIYNGEIPIDIDVEVELSLHSEISRNTKIVVKQGSPGGFFSEPNGQATLMTLRGSQAIDQFNSNATMTISPGDEIILQAGINGGFQIDDGGIRIRQAK